MATITYKHPTPTSTTETELAAHSGHAITSAEPLASHLYDRAEVGPMMAVTFADGFQAQVFADELTEGPEPAAAEPGAVSADQDSPGLTLEQISLVGSAKWLLSNADEPEGPDYERALVELIATHVLGDVELSTTARKLLGRD